MGLVKVKIKNKTELAQRLLNGEVLYSNTKGDRLFFDEGSGYGNPFLIKLSSGNTCQMGVTWGIKEVYIEQTLKVLLESNHRVLCWVWDSGDEEGATRCTFIQSHDGIWFYDLEDTPWFHAKMVKGDDLAQRGDED